MPDDSMNLSGARPCANSKGVRLSLELRCSRPSHDVLRGGYNASSLARRDVVANRASSVLVIGSPCIVRFEARQERTLNLQQSLKDPNELTIRCASMG